MKRISYKYVTIVLLILLISILITSCQMESTNIEQPTKENVVDNEVAESKQIELTFDEVLVKNSEFIMIDKDNEIRTYHYSPDKQNYLYEIKEVLPIEGVPLPVIDLYYSNKKLDNITNTDIPAYWNRYKFRNNKSLDTVQWVNNEEAIIRDWVSEKVYIYNINTKKREFLFSTQDKPIREKYGSVKILSYDYNRKLNKLVVTSSRNNNYIHILDIQNSSWEEIYNSSNFSVQPGGWIINALWDKENNIYFDSATDEGKQLIKKFNYSNKEIIDFTKNAYLLNTSPDKKFITYVDKIKKVTVITDPKRNINIEIPMTEELTWNSNREFASVEDNKYVRVYHIDVEQGIVNIEKYDVSNLMKDGEYIYNLQFVDNKLRFDIVDFYFYNEHQIDSLYATTYECTQTGSSETTFKDIGFKNSINQLLISSNDISINNLKDIEELVIYGQHCGTNEEKVLEEYKSDLKSGSIKSLEDLRLLPNLKKLTIVDNEIEDIDSIKNLKDLEYLDLSINHISDIKALTDKKNLKILHLSDNRISEITNLQGLDKIEFLSLDRNNIKDISTLQSLEKLRSVSFSHNQIKDISILMEIPNLESVKLDNNPIQASSVITELKKKDVYVDTNDYIENGM